MAARKKRYGLDPGPAPGRTPPLYRVGDRVRIPFGVSTVEATIVEDRGAIGYRGRRLYRVIADEPEHFFHLDTERAEEEMERVRQN